MQFWALRYPGKEGNELMQNTPERTKLYCQVATTKAVFEKMYPRKNKNCSVKAATDAVGERVMSNSHPRQISSILIPGSNATLTNWLIRIAFKLTSC